MVLLQYILEQDPTKTIKIPPFPDQVEFLMYWTYTPFGPTSAPLGIRQIICLLVKEFPKIFLLYKG